MPIYGAPPAACSFYLPSSHAVVMVEPAQDQNANWLGTATDEKGRKNDLLGCTLNVGASVQGFPSSGPFGGGSHRVELDVTKMPAQLWCVCANASGVGTPGRATLGFGLIPWPW